MFETPYMLIALIATVFLVVIVVLYARAVIDLAATKKLLHNCQSDHHRHQEIIGNKSKAINALEARIEDLKLDVQVGRVEYSISDLERLPIYTVHRRHRTPFDDLVGKHSFEHLLTTTDPEAAIRASADRTTSTRVRAGFRAPNGDLFFDNSIKKAN